MIKLLKRILDSSGVYKKRITVAFVFSFLKSVLMKAPIGFAFIAINAFTQKAMTGKLCLTIGIAMAICVALQAVVDIISDRLQSTAGYELFADKRIELGKHLRKMPMGYFTEGNIGKISSVLSTDMVFIEENCMTAIAGTVSEIFAEAIMIVFLFYLNVWLGLTGILILGIILLVAKGMKKEAMRDSSARQEQSENLTEAVLDYIEGIGIIKTYNMLGEKSKELSDNFNNSCETNLHFENAHGPWQMGLNLIYGIGASVIIAVAFLLQAKGTLSSVYVVGLLLFVFDLFGPLKALYGGIMGVSFAYVPSMQAIADGYGIDTILGAQIVGGVVAVIMGIMVKKIRVFFPPLITGTVVFTIGLSLYPTAINYMAGGTSNPDYGSWQNWLVAFFTLAVVTVLNHFGKGIWKLSSILIGMLAGYVVSIPFGMVDLSSVGKASVFQVPQPLHFGVHFEISACVAIGLLFAINSIQAIGDYSATTIGAMNRTPKDSELQGGIVAYGITNILGALFGGLPTATYSQNVGIVTTTKVINRWVLGLAAAFLGIAGFVPKFSALLTTIPQCVLGGATVSVFASIAMTGMKLVASAEMDYRNSSIVGLAAALGVGVSQANAALATLPAWVTTIFGKSPVVLATIIAVCLNLILPKSRDEEKEEKIYDSQVQEKLEEDHKMFENDQK